MANKEEHKTMPACYCRPAGNKVITGGSTEPGKQDFSAVAALPDDWVPKRSGDTLANYLKEREKKHEELLKELASEMCECNKKIDDKVRELAERLVSFIQQNQFQIDATIQPFGSCDQPLTPTKRDEALKKIRCLYFQRLEDIARFRKDGLALERERAECFKKIMRDQFQRLVAVGHHTPKDLLHDFDERMYELNQQLLSNHRAFYEMEAERVAEADENVAKARSTINQLCLGVPTSYRCQSSRRRSSTRSVSGKRSQSASGTRKEFSEPITDREISVAQEEMARCVTQIVEAYRQAVCQTFSGFSSKLSDLHNVLSCVDSDEMLKHGNHTPTCSKLEQMIEDVLGRVAATCHQKISIITMDMFEKAQEEVLTVQKSLWSLGECLRDKYTILHNAGHLWDDHILRSAYAQKLTIAAVEDLLTNNDIQELIHEINFNILFDKMCCSPDEEKLIQSRDALITVLNEIEKLYMQHSVAEMDRLEQFMDLPPSLAKVLIAELQCFLARYPRKAKYSLATPPTPEQRISEAPEGQLALIIKQTDLQEIALSNWRNGFLEAFESNTVQVPDDINRQARLWVDERSAPLHMRHAFKLLSHSVRKERIQAAYEARLAELKHHENRLQSHLKAVGELVNLPQEFSNTLSLEDPKLYPLANWLDHIKKEMSVVNDDPHISQDVKDRKLKSYSPRVKQYYNLFVNSVDKRIMELKIHLDERIQNARIANYMFLDKLKLFSEGGKYAASEALKAGTALFQAAEMLQTCQHHTSESFQTCRNKLLNIAEEMVAPLCTVEKSNPKEKKDKSISKENKPNSKKKS